MNVRDALGRTVLHLAAASTAPSAPEYIRMLLAHPHINVNLQDYESHWTALHHALYHGNIATALLLLQRNDIEPDLKDLEGYRAFDLYNSTVEHTKPDKGNGLLYTWGTNRNASLGLGDPDDRTFPDLVVLERPDTSSVDTLDTRFQPVFVDKVAMAKLHTAVLTNEPRNNIRLCGFGSGGRLGPGNHTQYAFQSIPLPSSTGPPPSQYSQYGATSGSSQRIVEIALGQDHTLALTAAGEVLSWGLNRFSQLGYVVDGATNLLNGTKEEIQSMPRKVPSLKNKFIIGVAACKTASVCWVENEVWTWGTNGGQLGYDRSAHPVQVTPRIVTKITQSVLSIAITDSAMACLLETNDVVCLCNDIYFKINFPTQTFPSEIATYRPPQAVRNASIQKITSCENTFAALSSNGELFMFTLPSAGVVKPQRVWALRKQFSAVTDVALGADSSIIICTESGHVFVRSRTFKSISSTGSAAGGSSAKTFKFQRVPSIHRVKSVCANSTGAFGAIKLETGAQDVKVEGPLIQESLAHIQPYVPWDETMSEDDGSSERSSDIVKSGMEVEEVDDDDDAAISMDAREIVRLCRLLLQDRLARKDTGGLFNSSDLSFGADLIVRTQSGTELPCHKLVLAARSSVLSSILEGTDVIHNRDWNISIKLASPSKRCTTCYCPDGLRLAPWAKKSHLMISGVHPLSVLVLLEYLYTDEVLAIWDPRISRLVQGHLTSLKTKSAVIKLELQRLAQLLDLPFLSKVLDAPVKRTPEPSMAANLLHLSETIQSSWKDMSSEHPSKPDVVLVFADREVPCHSTVLRSRSELFAAFFDDEQWTKRRWTEEDLVRVDLSHMRWNTASYVVKFLYGGDVRMFDVMEFINTVDELVEFMFEIMACANELLLDRLFLICASVIVKRVNITNACLVLNEASYYNVIPLIRSIQQYIAINLETFLESHLLDDLPNDLLRQLSVFVREQQASKSPVSRSGILTNMAMEKHKEWLAMEDFPQPITKTSRHPSRIVSSAKLSPPTPSRKKERSLGSIISPSTSPALRPQISPLAPQPPHVGPAEDEVFMMDETVPSLNLNQSAGPSIKLESQGQSGKPTVSWKVSSVPKVDMKAIMAEAATSRLIGSRTSSSSNLQQAATGVAADAANWRTPQQTNRPLPETPERPAPRNASGSPWRVPSVGTLAAPSSPPGTPPTGSQVQAPPSRGKETSLPSASKPPLVTRSSVGYREPMTPPRVPGMGPVFTPSKQGPSKPGPSSGAHRVSNGTAWTLPPVQPSVKPASSGSSMSFTAIQMAQLEQETVPVKDKRSLKEIQEEEQARQVEEDFMKWWAAEEERVKQEEQAIVAALAPSRPQQQKAKKGKAKGSSAQGPNPKPSRQTQEPQVQQRQEQAGDGVRKRNRRPVGKKEAKVPQAPGPQ